MWFLLQTWGVDRVNKIKLVDGTQFEVFSLGVYAEILHITLWDTGEKVSALAAIFDNPEKTNRITYGEEEPAAEFVGYTVLASISDRRDIDGGVLVQLQKGE